MPLIPMQRRDGRVTDYALVDDADFGRISLYRWHLSGEGYAQRSIGLGLTAYLHREIIGLIPDGLEVDHRNGDRLDNRRANLRVVTRSLNAHNRHHPPTASSGHRNVRRMGKRWQVMVQVERRRYNLGCYDTPEIAAEVARDFRRMRGLLP